MLIAPTAVVALLLLTGLYRAVRGWRRRRSVERTMLRLTAAQLQRDIEALTAGAHQRASAVRVLAEADLILDRALALYGPTTTARPETEGDSDEQP
ncbi:hypothetical protein [Streptomyces sp. NPDC048611]|uniref:hypothetical protein n=1 Tax=Streptomyces sp. NPDC048611 TaxID=3155635 RepID=UPI003422AFF5